MTLDLAVHGWDLATGIGVGHRIPDELAGDLLRVFEDVIPRWQGLGLFAEPVAVPADASPHARLLGLLGRRPDTP